ncbi:MAG: 6-bladed beta-propeller [Gemmatimonadota bacterium]
MRRRTPTPTIAPIFLASLTSLTAACGSDAGSSATWSGTVDTLSDGRVVVSSDAPVWPDESRPSLTEELRIGSTMGDGPEAFGDVEDLLVDDAGRIYVLEGQAQEVRVFDSGGAWLHTIGRRGEGPGELKRAAAMGWGPDGVLRVVDYGNGRISDFRPEGEFVEGHRQEAGFVMFPWPGVFERSGGLINISPAVRDGEFNTVLIRHAPDMEPVDTLAIPEYAGEQAFFEHSTDGGRIRATVPFTRGLSWDLDPRGYFWIAPDTGIYEILQVSLEGDTLLTIRRPAEKHPVTRAEIDSAIAGLEWFTDQGGTIDRSEFPATKPVIRHVFAPGDGRVYVVPVTDEFGSGHLSGGTSLDVFDTSGYYLGRLELPEGMRTSDPEPVFRGDHVVAVVLDELDVPYVVRYRLTEPAFASEEAT